MIKYRHFEPGDGGRVENFFTSVFSESEGETEGRLIGGLARELIERTAVEDRIVCVALKGDELIGAIFITRMPAAQEAEIFVLGPVAVDSRDQGKGVGQGLINYGIRQLRERGAKILVTYGDPAFYSKTGFCRISEAMIEAPFKLSQPECWLAQTLDGSPLSKVEGRCSCVEALNDPRYW